jgi:hypothetical protein
MKILNAAAASPVTPKGAVKRTWPVQVARKKKAAQGRHLNLNLLVVVQAANMLALTSDGMRPSLPTGSRFR